MKYNIRRSQEKYCFNKFTLIEVKLNCGSVITISFSDGSPWQTKTNIKVWNTSKIAAALWMYFMKLLPLLILLKTHYYFVIERSRNDVIIEF